MSRRMIAALVLAVALVALVALPVTASEAPTVTPQIEITTEQAEPTPVELDLEALLDDDRQNQVSCFSNFQCQDYCRVTYGEGWTGTCFQNWCFCTSP